MMRRKKTRRILAGIILLVAVAAAAVPVSRRASADEGDDSVNSIKETVMQRALQCYVIEGAYPQSLEYLEENYGLTVNKEDYLIVYAPFAENLPPEVKVLDRHAPD
ncbi:MAG: hypothetical protein IJ860_07630 [Eubacterium sp.]|nr:hypothetical protein [Eubacterium sp.]